MLKKQTSCQLDMGTTGEPGTALGKGDCPPQTPASQAFLCSRPPAGGPSLAEIRDAAGHNNAAVTSVYTHVATDDNGRVAYAFKFSRNGLSHEPWCKDLAGVNGDLTFGCC